jgi:transcriptional regulator with XRE-family HTH domain
MDNSMANPPAADAFVANVLREMQARGWNRSKLAEECNWPPPRITEILGKKRDFQLGTMETIADAFGVTVASLLIPRVEISEKTPPIAQISGLPFA